MHEFNAQNVGTYPFSWKFKILTNITTIEISHRYCFRARAHLIGDTLYPRSSCKCVGSLHIRYISHLYAALNVPYTRKSYIRTLFFTTLRTFRERKATRRIDITKVKLNWNWLSVGYEYMYIWVGARIRQIPCCPNMLRNNFADNEYEYTLWVYWIRARIVLWNYPFLSSNSYSRIPWTTDFDECPISPINDPQGVYVR